MPGRFAFCTLTAESRLSVRAIVCPFHALRLAHVREADTGRRGRTRQDGNRGKSGAILGLAKKFAHIYQCGSPVNPNLPRAVPPRATAAGSLAIAHRPP